MVTGVTKFTDGKRAMPVVVNVLNCELLDRAPDLAWETDIKVLWMQPGQAYLTVLIDLYARRVIG